MPPPPPGISGKPAGSPQEIDLPAEGEIDLTHPRPEEGYYAYYIDLAYPVGDLTMWLCTQLRIAGKE